MFFEVHRNGQERQFEIPSRFEIKCFTLWSFTLKFFNKVENVIIRNLLSLPLLNAKDFLRDTNLHVVLSL